MYREQYGEYAYWCRAVKGKISKECNMEICTAPDNLFIHSQYTILQLCT